MENLQFDNSSFISMMNEESDRFRLRLNNASLIEVFDAYIKHRSITHPKFAEQWGTTRKYIRGLEFLCQQTITPDKVGELFYPHLIRYMQQNDCATTTIQHTCSQIRSSLEWGSRYGAPISPSYDQVDFTGCPRDKTILSYAELCHLFFFNVKTLRKPNGKKYRSQWYNRMEKVKDLFVFSVILGQRHSDIVRVTKDNFKDDVFAITQLKTGNKVSFKWEDYAFDKKIAIALFEKYDYACPYKVSISVYNRGLHELFHLIGQEFLQVINMEEKILGEMRLQSKQRWQMIGSHTARRTAISFWANQGKSMNWIRKFSGHKDLRSLQEYMLDEN